MQQFNALRIERQQYGIDKGKLLGAIEFEGQYTKMTVKLSEEQSQKMLTIVAEAAADNAREVASIMTADFAAMAGAKLLESGEAEVI